MSIFNTPTHKSWGSHEWKWQCGQCRIINVSRFNWETKERTNEWKNKRTDGRTDGQRRVEQISWLRLFHFETCTSNRNDQLAIFVSGWNMHSRWYPEYGTRSGDSFLTLRGILYTVLRGQQAIRDLFIVNKSRHGSGDTMRRQSGHGME